MSHVTRPVTRMKQQSHHVVQLFDVAEENMFQVINDLFLAGAETTYVSLEWSVVYMTEFPAIQKKCFDEIDRVSV